MFEKLGEGWDWILVAVFYEHSSGPSGSIWGRGILNKL